MMTTIVLPRARGLLAILFPAMILLAGCASTHRADDPDKPKPVCASTTIGSEPKTFCY